MQVCEPTTMNSLDTNQPFIHLFIYVCVYVYICFGVKYSFIEWISPPILSSQLYSTPLPHTPHSSEEPCYSPKACSPLQRKALEGHRQDWGNHWVRVRVGQHLRVHASYAASSLPGFGSLTSAHYPTLGNVLNASWSYFLHLHNGDKNTVYVDEWFWGFSESLH